MSALPKAALAVALLVLATGPGRAQEPFPHEAHEGLFPLCSGCHAIGGGEAGLYPDPDLCGRCHDGAELAPVAWTPPATTDYQHPDHEAAAGVALDCRYCHGEGGSNALADLPASCGNCHEPHHSGSVHCRACHGSDIQSLHEPAAHAGCAGSGCHAPDRVEGLRFNRELCLVCHPAMGDHKPGRPCGRCHAVGQPG